MLKHVPRPAWLLFRVVTAVVLCIIVIRSLDLSLLVRKLTTIDRFWICVCLFIPFIGLGLSALRWQVALGMLGVDRPYRELVLRYWSGAFYNTLLPGTVGGDLVRVGGLARSGVPLAKGSLSVLADRVIGLWASMVLGLFGSIWASQSPHARTLNWIFGIIVVGGILGVLLLHTFSSYVPAQLHRYTTLVVAFGTRRLWLMLCLAGIFQILVILQLYAAVHALQAPISLLACAIYAPAVVLATAMPISLNGIGVREGTLIVLLAGLGISLETATLAGFLIYITTVMSSLPGALMMLVLPKSTMLPGND